MNIRYHFKNAELLKMALTHTSFTHDTGEANNQRLEFLGDSVLSFVIATEIYKLYPEFSEGKLTKARAALVCESSLAKLATSMDIGKNIRFGRSEAMSDGVHKASILADTFEAILGAIYLDSDIETAKKWVLDLFVDLLENFEIKPELDYKSELQIYFQKRDKNTQVVKYRVKSRKGPDHNPTFTAEAVYEGKVIGTGEGKNLKIAEKNAACDALKGLGLNNEKI